MANQKILKTLGKLPQLCVFDFETSGLNPYHDRIIEIAGWRQKKMYHSLCSLGEEQLSPKITEITHITQEMLSQAPSERRAISGFIHSLGTRRSVCYLIAHNCEAFDKQFLRSRAQHYTIRVPTSWRYLDTLQISKLLYPGRSSYSQASLCQDFGIVQTNAHRATNDVECLTALLSHLIPDYASTRNLPLKKESDYVECLEAMWKETQFKN